MENEDYIDESWLLSLGFKETSKDEEWPHTMIYSKGAFTIQYILPWGQGNMDEGYLLKKDDIEIPFSGYRNTLSGKLPNGYILFKTDLEKLLSQYGFTEMSLNFDKNLFLPNDHTFDFNGSIFHSYDGKNWTCNGEPIKFPVDVGNGWSMTGISDGGTPELGKDDD